MIWRMRALHRDCRWPLRLEQLPRNQDQNSERTFPTSWSGLAEPQEASGKCRSSFVVSEHTGGVIGLSPLCTEHPIEPTTARTKRCTGQEGVVCVRRTLHKSSTMRPAAPAGSGGPAPHPAPRSRPAGSAGPRLRPGRPTRALRPLAPIQLSGCLAAAEVVVVDVVGHLVEVVVGSARGAEPPYRQHGDADRSVRSGRSMDEWSVWTSPRTSSQPTHSQLPGENPYSSVARSSARRAEGTLWCTGVECCVQVRRGRWKGHDEAPFLDGRGLRGGPALSMLQPASGRWFRGDGRTRRIPSGQYSEGSSRVVA